MQGVGQMYKTSQFFGQGCQSSDLHFSISQGNAEGTEAGFGERKGKKVSSSPSREKMIYHQVPRDSSGLIVGIKVNQEV